MISFPSFPLPWNLEDTGSAFTVRDAKGQALAYVHYRETENGMRHGPHTKEEAMQIADNNCQATWAPKEVRVRELG